LSYQTNKPPVLIQELMGLPREARKDLTIRNRSPLRFGHRINEGDMLISLHRLLSAVLAIDAIQMRTKDNPDDPLRRLHGECFEDEVTHLLVSTAAFNRVYRMQRHPRRISPDNITIEPVQGPCGNLWIDSHDPQSQQPLSFKDACDKILHADVINFSTPLKTFTMMGKFGGKAWTAELDLVQYVRLSTQNFGPIYYEPQWNT
jgi:hypothetical protein